MIALAFIIGIIEYSFPEATEFFFEGWSITTYFWDFIFGNLLISLSIQLLAVRVVKRPTSWGDVGRAEWLRGMM